MNSNQEELNDLFDEQVNRDHKRIAYTLEPLSKKDQKISDREEFNKWKKILSQGKIVSFMWGSHTNDITLKTPNLKIVDGDVITEDFFHFDNGQKNELND